MSKKPTNWVTIPEEKIHTPASKIKKGRAEEPVRNKIFWGVGFAIMVVVSFALLAPSQFNEMLKSSLFDATGTMSEEASMPGLITDDTDDEEESEEVVEEEVVEEVVEEASDLFVSDPVVQAEEEAVSISVEPIVTAEEIIIEPVGPESEDCGTDVICFVAHLTDCSLAKVDYTVEVMGQSVSADLDLTGEEEEKCVVSAAFTDGPLLLAIKGTEATCKLAKGEYTEDSLAAEFSDLEKLKSSCTGSAIDLLDQFSAFIGDTKEETEEETSAKDKLIEELSKQIGQLQDQKGMQDQALQDLTNIVQEELQEAAPAAPVTPDQALGAVNQVLQNIPGGFPIQTLPTGILSTASIGQPQAVQPGYRLNPYVVSATPEQVLAQNQAGGVQLAQASYTPSPVYQQTAQPLIMGDRTPDTGPSEVIFMTLLLAFFGLIGWKFIRVFA